MGLLACGESGEMDTEDIQTFIGRIKRDISDGKSDEEIFQYLLPLVE